jgi:hypothetical protein
MIEHIERAEFGQVAHARKLQEFLPVATGMRGGIEGQSGEAA